MNLRDLPARSDRLQQSRLFKIIASIVLTVFAVGGVVAYAIQASKAPGADLSGFVAPPAEPGAEPSGKPSNEQITMDATKAVVEDILTNRHDPVSVAISVAIVWAVCLAVVWLGLGVWFGALALLAGGVGLATMRTKLGEAYAPVVLGILGLLAAWLVLLRLAGLALAGSNPVMAIARTVLHEAVRLKLTLLPILLLLFGLAALPTVLQEDQPLRYRVQSFLQYGTGASFWLIAVLVVTFSVATVAFDQRDKTIWQTMTKPVSALQYVLGKWLGIVTLGAILLAVSGAGVFMFVEYLRLQPARGEKQAYIAEEGPISEDRLVLESQVLTARDSVSASPFAYDRAQFDKNVAAMVEEEMKRRREAGETEENQLKIRDGLAAAMRESLQKSAQVLYRTVPKGQGQTYRFEGLEEAKKSKRPVILRYKINSGSNSPDSLYRITIEFRNGPPQVQEVVLAQWQYIRLLPDVINDEGAVEMGVFNGDVFKQTINPESIVFPPDGLEVSYAAGTYRANFIRVMAVLWVKLAFLAMLGVCLATFLSFPVAILVAVTVFFAAEGAGFLRSALENFWTTDTQGKTIYINIPIQWVATAIATIFRSYADLRPTARLVEGLRLPLSSVLGGVCALGLATAGLLGAGVLVLRRRELATYSGQ